MVATSSEIVEVEIESSCQRESESRGQAQRSISAGREG